MPFVSFSREGCSWWLTEQLAAAGIREDRLLWLNADMAHVNEIIGQRPQAVLALGLTAAKLLHRFGVHHELFDHPQSHKRFRYTEPYPLVTRLQEITA